ncbi:kinase-like protein [Tothia fuscella]|uniref:Kinase-like protein n=1 Tax=Tothia fuscella TaxID=1048955 RepID=A0A9P4TZ72_9PEZI|nr:kinase-like protein [Tothia fuscella]
MSTPSTATATHTPHHPQFYPNHQSHHHHQPVQNYHLAGPIVNGTPTSRLTGPSAAGPQQHYNGNGYSSASGPNTTASTASATTTSDLRRTITNNSRPENTLPPIKSPPSADMARDKRGRQVDWNEFYKNGVPEEIIVIEDDTPPPSSSRAQTLNHTSLTNGVARPAEKKRKVGGPPYDPVYNNPQPSYSTTQTPYYENSSSKNNTASTDRTTSAYITTAATSLGSQASNGNTNANAHPNYLPPLEDGVVGQKRKRTRAAAAEEAQGAKRRELDRLSPLSIHYVPPTKPIVKAKDVPVEVIPDVCCPDKPVHRYLADSIQRSHMKDKKVDDDDGHYIVTPDADLTTRYQIVRLLGQGTFGKVVEAYDKTKKTRCAIKIIRSVQKYRDASRIELRVLSTLAQNDKHNRNKCIHLRQCFDFRQHICIVTDLYGQSVFDFLKINQFTPFPSTHIQTFARQLLTSVAFLHDLNLIHTDLKPENILLVENNYQTFTYNRSIPSSTTATSRSSRHRKVLLNPEIRLIDFGSATFNDEYHSSVVSTRHYRAPEIILNLGWSFPCDIWSIGCILVEFFTGDALFQTHDNLEHLAMMEAVCNSKLDRALIQAVLTKERGSSTKNPAAQYFKGREKKLDYPNQETPKASRKYVRAMKKLEDTIQPHTEFNRQFLDLLRKIFVYNPDKRITAKQALKHQWFRETLQDDGTEATRIRDEKAALAEAAKRDAERRAPAYHPR